MNFVSSISRQNNLPGKAMKQGRVSIRTSSKFQNPLGPVLSKPVPPQNKKNTDYDIPEKCSNFIEKEAINQPLIRKSSVTNNQQKDQSSEECPTEKSKISLSSKTKVNLRNKSLRPPNLFSHQMKDKGINNFGEKNVDVENLMKPQNNTITKTVNPPVRIRVMKANTQENKKKTQNLSHLATGQVLGAGKKGHHGPIQILKESKSIDFEDVTLSPSSTQNQNKPNKNQDSRLEKDIEEEKTQEIKELSNNEHSIKLDNTFTSQRRSSVKKSQFIIQTKSSVIKTQQKNESQNTKESLHLSANSGTHFYNKHSNINKEIEIKVKEIPIEKSNVYTEINIQPQHLTESLFSEQQMKNLSISHKLKGNEYYKVGNYKKAIEEYSKAIKFYSKDSTYFSNRAVCYKILVEWEKVFLDCEASIILDQKNFKAINLKGHALVELGKRESGNKKINEGILALEKAYKIYNEKGEVGDQSIKSELEVKIYKAKKINWLKNYKKENSQRNDIFDYINKLIDDDTKLKTNLKFDPKETFSQFKREKDGQKEIPEFLCCKITFDIMRDPIMTPYGISYEKLVVLEHLKKNGAFDPVTRRPLPPQFLIQNKTLNEAIKDFMDKNPWAYEFVDLEEDYLEISL